MPIPFTDLTILLENRREETVNENIVGKAGRFSMGLHLCLVAGHYEHYEE